MFEVAISGTLVSERYQIRVPVLRRGRILFERRSFGSRTLRIDDAVGFFDAWESLPVGGRTFSLGGPWGLRVKRVVGGQESGFYVTATLVYRGGDVLSAYKTVLLPSVGPFRLKREFRFSGAIEDGVTFDVKTTLSFAP